MIGLEPLERDLEVDVAVVGGGFTGLATAWHLQRRDRRCAVLEAGEIGAGASGTTGGQVVPRFKSTFPELERSYGRDTALAMHRIAHAGADLVEKAVAEAEARPAATADEVFAHTYAAIPPDLQAQLDALKATLPEGRR